MSKQFLLVDNGIDNIHPRQYRPFLSIVENGKGVLDCDTVKGCTLGMAAYPDGGCYGSCYANKTAARYGIDFSISVTRILTTLHIEGCFNYVRKHHSPWYRIGTAGDPCHDWENTLSICEILRDTGKTPVIITKHWKTLSDSNLLRLKKLSAVINTSTSGMDTDSEIKHLVAQMERIKKAGVHSVNRIVTCSYGTTEWGRTCNDKQKYLLSFDNVIDNPLRTTKTNQHVIDGDILLTKVAGAVGGGSKFVSLHRPNVYLGTCTACPDQCGVKKTIKIIKREGIDMVQKSLFEDTVEFIYVESVIGSGYEQDVARLAIEDGVAYRAARKNMQIHSAIILKINNVFSGFFTFQVNHEAKEFCLLQSAMYLDKKDKGIYSQMVKKIIEQNTFGYPMIMTVSTKHDLENPKVFESVGFKTYLELSGYAYMVYGKLEDVRMKRLAHATMTNVWNSTKGDWLRMKKEWNERIEAAGTKHNIQNPKFASRDGCWQGANGMSNIVLSSQEININGEIQHNKGKSFNGNASVLDPVACEVILRFFMPTGGFSIYNPFGGGVQMGFVTGAYGYEYLSSEIRQNQCDVNNAICQDFYNTKWLKSDSSKFTPKKKYDLCFSCPPYYQVEEYLDYEGVSPEGELNAIPTYEQFRDTLFEGYKRGIEVLNDNCFFVIMTGDSRDKNGAYYGCEAEHELFFKQQGLHIYNKITYLECEFTRLAHAKVTLNYRKFPKREQKILVFYKGDMSKIRELYPPIGRL